MKGRFVTFEGIEGSGKSTVASAVHEALVRSGIDALITREPGGTEVSELLRKILLDPERIEMGDRTELLLYVAARAQLVEELIRPALEAGRSVICDRFMDASVAYQGWARGLGEDLVRELNLFAVGKTLPDRTFLLDIPVEKGFSRGPEKREMEAGKGRDRLEMEERAFHEKVREGYLRIAEKEEKRIVVLNASALLVEVIAEAKRNIEILFGVHIL